MKDVIPKEKKIALDYVLGDFGMLDAGQISTIIGFASVGWSASLDLKERLDQSSNAAYEHHSRIAEGLAEIFHQIGQNAVSISELFGTLPKRWEEDGKIQP